METDELDILRRLVREQDARLQALEARVGVAPAVPAPQGSDDGTPAPAAAPTRRQVIALAGLAAAGGAAAGSILAGSYPALGTDDIASSSDLDAHIENPTGAHPASAISFEPYGEITASDAAAALQQLDERVRALRFMDDLGAAAIVYDDFYGPLAGWFTATRDGGRIDPIDGDGGLLSLDTGTTGSGASAITKGSTQRPVGGAWAAEWRAKVLELSTANDEYDVTLGVCSDPTGGEPSVGFYLRYDRDELGPNWFACVATGSDHRRVDTGVPVAADTFVRARIMSDGSGVAHFVVDGRQVGSVGTGVIAEGTTIGPAASIAKATGAASRTLVVDYFAARFEMAR